MTLPFLDKTVLITGGGTGIGKGCAEYFLERGAWVTICGPDLSALDAAVEELKQTTRIESIDAVLCDVTEEDQVENAVKAAARGGNLDILVANAGTGFPGPIQLLDKTQWHIPYDVNVVGTALCIKHSSQIMKHHGGGAIVAISSVEALRASRFMPIYNVTKAALDSLVPCAARELGRFNIRVNGIRPGVILTESLGAMLSEKNIESGLRKTFLARLGQPLDIAKAVAFFASEQAEWITGQVLNVCGGMSVHAGDNYESLARMVFGDEAIEQTKTIRDEI
jgi:NAD(P)-dependent dehydrogenase (short-subunit alcohol dehydrogenase family)